ncbi:hypothetical protein ES705_39554 [subsurface metagenome]
MTLARIKLGSMMIGVLDEKRDTSVHHNKGVFGGAVFIPYVVKIDLDYSKLTLYDPETYQPEEGWEEVSLHLSESNLPFIETTISIGSSENVPVKLILDTGAEGAMLLITDEDKHIIQPSRIVYSLSGTGLRGDVFTNHGRISELKIGDYQFSDVIVSIFGKNEIKDKIPALGELQCDGVIGVGCLYRFNMIFDYAHKRMFIKPNKYFSDIFEMNMAGMVIKEMGSGAHVVYYLMENSPASEQGLRNTYIRAFFGKYLKGEDSGLLNGPYSMYPEVEIKVKNIR